MGRRDPLKRLLELVAARDKAERRAVEAATDIVLLVYGEALKELADG